jgi:RNA polymerase sigma-70 factor (ECF subfamily)
MTIARDILDSEQDAEECVSDVYLKVWNSIPPDEPSSLKAYMAVLTRRLAINRYHESRAQRRNRELEVAFEELEACIPAPEEAAGELPELLNEFLAGLKDTDRRLFVRRYWYAMMPAELAKREGMTVNAVTVKLYKTRNKLCETALSSGESGKCNFARTTLDLTTADGLPLFHNAHKWGADTGTNGTQANAFWGDIFATGAAGSREYSTATFEKALYDLSIKLRSMKDENGEPLGYSADTIILPGNRPMAELIAKKVCGSELAPGNNYNDVNLHFGKWNVVVLPGWQSDTDAVMIMSSEANKNLAGNMFFNRIPLTVTNWVDNHTGNYIWNGRCRFGVGFGNYKHIILATDSASAVSNATKL